MIFSFSKDTRVSSSNLVDLACSHPDKFSFISDQKLKVISKKRRAIATLEEAEKIIGQFDHYIVEN
jgi:hypothetical protein